MMRATLVSVLLAAGCGANGGGRTMAEGAKVPPTAGAAAGTTFAAAPPFVSPGERIAYRLRMHEVDIAMFTVAVGEPEVLDGREVIVVQSSVHSSDFVSIFRKVEDHFTSWIDVETSRSVLFRAVELASPDGELESTEAAAGRVDEGAFEVRVQRPGGEELVERQQVGVVPVFDFNSFLVALRRWEPPRGTVDSADVIRSRYMWRTEVTLAGYETLATELGELPTMRLDGISRRLTRDGAIDPAISERHYRLWISDDADRVPLQVVARTDYGDVRMDIVEYEPGGARVGE